MSLRKNLSLKGLLRFMKLWGPYLGAGIKPSYEKETDTIVVKMHLRWYNKNYVMTHFGGSLYAMCDPFFMLILMRKLGRDYIVWDKEASIAFKRPGRGTVCARFHIPDKRVEEIRHEADQGKKVHPVFSVDVLDPQGDVVATVEKLLYVKKKEPKSGG